MMKCKITLLIFFLMAISCDGHAEPDKGKPADNDTLVAKENYSVIQYNIHYGVGIDGKYNIQRIIDVLKKSGADIIIINESDKYYSGRSNNQYMSEYIAKQLGMNFIHESSIVIANPNGNDREVGNAVMTKYDVKLVKHMYFSVGDQWPRVITKSIITFPDKKVLYVGMTHFGLTEDGRNVQAKETLKFMSDIDDYPVIIAGDLNDTPTSAAVMTLTTKYQDALGAKPTVFSFPSNKPTIRIDYILANDKVTFIGEAKTIDSQASDHLPVMATIKF